MTAASPSSRNAATAGRIASSFRDPHGHIVRLDGEFVRVLAPSYREHFDLLQQSGLYDRLVAAGLLLAHSERDARAVPGAFKVLRPTQLNFVSYPYEWCFSEWRDAALATLQIQEEAIGCGMTLKDASAFNIQFVDGRPALIDLSSFAKLELRPWVAYAQFCRHFLAPLALMAHCDGRLGQMFREHIDGIPLDLASKLLPLRTKLKPSLFVHLHAHAASGRWLGKNAGAKTKEDSSRFSRASLLGLVQMLRSGLQGLDYKPRRDLWANYYSETVTGGDYVARKESVVRQWIEELRPAKTWDLGANTGRFSRIAASAGSNTVSFDGDIDCVELSYRELRESKNTAVLPLYLDLANPSPALGWAHAERMSWLERGEPNVVLALALIHHLAIGNNVPLAHLAAFFARFSQALIIEFVPKDDPNARKLLDVREDIFSGYTREMFEQLFQEWFTLERWEPMAASERVLYLLRRKRQGA